MAKALILTDNTSLMFGAPRYLGPYRIADELEKIGFSTFVLDHFFSFPNILELIEQILDESYLIVGISSTFMTPTTPNLGARTGRTVEYFTSAIIDNDYVRIQKWFSDLKNILKRKAPKAQIFLGGAKASRFLDSPLNDCTEIDYLVLGASDFAFASAAKELLANMEIKYVQPKKIKMLDTSETYRQESICPRHQWRAQWGIQYGEALPIEISRGCVFNCKFCLYEKKRSDCKSPSDLREEFIDNYEKFGVTNYHFLDDCLNDHAKKIDFICSVIESLPFKIEWVSYARFDVAVRFPETTRRMIKCGAKGIYWGVESLTHEVARKAGKGTPSEKIKELILTLRKEYQDECYFSGSFISGLPGETEMSWRESYDWLLEYDSFHFIQVGSLLIAPYKAYLDMKEIDYADYSRNPEKYGFKELRFNPHYWRHETMDFHQAEILTNELLEKWFQKNPKGLSQDIWQYPYWRSQGFSKEQIHSFFFENDPVIKNNHQYLLSKSRTQSISKYQDWVNNRIKLTQAERSSHQLSLLV